MEKLLKSGLLGEEGPSIVEMLPLAQAIRIDDKSLTFMSPVKPTLLNVRQSLQGLSYSLGDYLKLKGPHSRELAFVVDCLNCNIPLLLVSNQTPRLTEDLQTLARVAGHRVNRILLNERSDTSQLLGCFE